MTTPGLPPRPISGSSLRPIEQSDLAGSAFEFERDDALDHEDYEPGRGGRFRAFVGRGLLRLGWLALAVGLAFGSAGIVAAAQPSPSTGARPEITWGADQVLSAKLDAAVRDLVAVHDDVDSLDQMARQTLSSLAQLDQSGLKSAWDQGSNDVNSIDAGAADLNNRLQCGAWDSTLQVDLVKSNSPAMVDRYHQVCLAVASVAPLHDDWVAMVDGSQTALQVANDIETHDSLAADALQLATQGRYPEALTKLSGASALIADASSIAAELAKVTDVSTLTEWLSRTTQMDDALQLLWQTMIDSNGKVTIQVTAALRAVNDATALLPNDNSVLQVVLQEMAGNLTSNGISIETARGALANALSDLVGGTVFGR
jgi:hypothetical protein